MGNVFGSGHTEKTQLRAAQQRQAELDAKAREEEAKADRLEAHNKEAMMRRNSAKKNIIAEDGEDTSAVKRKALLGG